MLGNAIDDISKIAELYNNDPERERLRLKRHQLEYDITWRYFNRHLPPQGSVLEVGAATGAYTLDLAARGYLVTAVDIAGALLENCRQLIAEHGLSERVRFVQADARDLGKLAKDGYDAILLMGPLYHLVEEADRKQAVKESVDRLCAGGILFSSFISRLGVLGDLLKKFPDWIERPSSSQRIAHGSEPGKNYYFATVAEIAPLHEEAALETVALAAAEPAISADDESYNKLEGERRQRWLDLFFEVSADPTIIGASRHLLYVGRKPIRNS